VRLLFATYLIAIFVIQPLKDASILEITLLDLFIKLRLRQLFMQSIGKARHIYQS